MKRFVLSAVALLALGTVVLAAATDWNAIISDYDKIVDKVIAVTAKVQAGDYNAAQELNTLNPKMQELSTKLATAKPGELTQDQMKKFQDIGAKYQKASAPKK